MRRIYLVVWAIVVLEFLIGCSSRRKGPLPDSSILFRSPIFYHLNHHFDGSVVGGTVATSYEMWGDHVINAKINAILRYQYDPTDSDPRLQPVQSVSLDLRLPLTTERSQLGLEFIKALEVYLGISSSGLQTQFLTAAMTQQVKDYGAEAHGDIVASISVQPYAERDGIFLTTAFYEQKYFESTFRPQIDPLPGLHQGR